MLEKKRKVSVLLSEFEFQQLDRLCKLNGYKKSTLIVRLIRTFLADNIAPDVDAISESKEGLKGEE
jgi:metal-responsive CopG/Arc/MetJ family transcriptional regulator